MMSKQAPIPLALMDLPVENLFPNTYNPNEMDDVAYSRLYIIMKRLQRAPSPLWVRCLKEGEDHLKHEHEIIDGFHRWSASKELGIEKVQVEVYNVSDIEAMSLCYQINTIRGSPNPFREGLFFLQAKNLVSNPADLIDHFMVRPEYIARRARLTKIIHIYQRHSDNPNILLSHWEIMANFWKSENDDGTLEDICLFLKDVQLPTDSVQRLVSKLRQTERNFNQLAMELIDREKHALPSEQKFTHIPSQQTTLDVRSEDVSIGDLSAEAAVSFRENPSEQTEQTSFSQPEQQTPTQTDKRVERKPYEEDDPPTSTYTVSCYTCRDESIVAMWEDALTAWCPSCGKEFKVVDENGLRSTVSKIAFRPKEKPFNRIYLPERYKDLGTEQIVKSRAT